MKSRSFRKRNRKLQLQQEQQEQQEQQQHEEIDDTRTRTRTDNDNNNENTCIDKPKKQQQQQQRKSLSNLNATNDLSLINTKIVRLTIPTNTNNTNTNNTLLLRIIEPYTYTFISNVKGRWINRTILDVYNTEFGSYPLSYYTMAIQQGRIQVSSQIVSIKYIIKENDILSHTVHRHEPAVAINSLYTNTSTHNSSSESLSNIISIVAETNDIIAVDKPSTMPVHPCGGYHKNTLMSILESIPLIPSNENQNVNQQRIQQVKRYKKLYTIHRLDRLTSGLVILAKSSEVAKQWSFAIQQKHSRNSNSNDNNSTNSTNSSCEKLYIAKVKGKFLSSLLLPTHNNNNNYYNQPQPTRLGLEPVEEGRCIEVPINGEWSIDNDIIDNNNNNNCNSAVSSTVSINTDDNQTKNSLSSTTNNNDNNNNKRKRQNKSIYQKQQQLKQKNDSNVSIATKAQMNRSTNAFGYWITNHLNQIQTNDDISLDDFCNIEHSIDEWLNVLQSSCSNTSTTASDSYNQELMQTINKQIFYWFNFACPVRVEQHKNGICSAGTFDTITDELYVTTVKAAQTSFAILHYDSNTDTTIVLCKPITGRTHQIRIHLQYLDNPIANDPNYGGTIWYNNPAGHYACTYAQQMLSLLSSTSSTTTTTTGSRDNEDTDNQNKNLLNDSSTSNSNTVFATRRDVPVTVYQNNNNNKTTENDCNNSATTTTTTTTTNNNDLLRNISDEPATDNEIMNSTIISEPQKDNETYDDFIKRTCVWCARIKSTSSSSSTCPIVVPTTATASSSNGTTETTSNKEQQQQLTSTTIYRSSATVDRNVNTDNDITVTNVEDTNINTNANEHILDRDSLEFLVRSPGLWLHALRYTVNGISFQTSLPDWSK